MRGGCTFKILPAENLAHSLPRASVSIWVSNNGDPLPENFDPTVASHLGLKIVENLARALGGRFTMRNDHGWTVAEVKFPKATGE